MIAPTVSIIVATYNYGHFLSEALDSILAQSYTDWETIIIDDGSTDSTPDIVIPYLHDKRIQYFRLNRAGQPAAKNYGIKQSRGTLVAFLDADDRWFPHKLEKQVPLFANNTVAVVYSLRKTMDEQSQELERTYLPPHRGDVLRPIFKDNFICFSSAVVRRNTLLAVGCFDETIPLAIDYDLWLRIARNGEFDYVDEPLVWYRTGHANLSRRGHERIQIVLGIMDRFVGDPNNAQRLGAAWIDRCYGETYCSASRTLAAASVDERRRWLFRSLRRYPLNTVAIKELVKISPPFSWFRKNASEE